MQCFYRYGALQKTFETILVNVYRYFFFLMSQPLCTQLFFALLQTLYVFSRMLLAFQKSCLLDDKDYIVVDIKRKTHATLAIVYHCEK